MLDDRCRFRGTERRTIHTQLPLYFAHQCEQNRLHKRAAVWLTAAALFGTLRIKETDPVKIQGRRCVTR